MMAPRICNAFFVFLILLNLHDECDLVTFLSFVGIAFFIEPDEYSDSQVITDKTEFLIISSNNKLNDDIDFSIIYLIL